MEPTTVYLDAALACAHARAALHSLGALEPGMGRAIKQEMRRLRLEVRAFLYRQEAILLLIQAAEDTAFHAAAWSSAGAAADPHADASAARAVYDHS